MLKQIPSVEGHVDFIAIHSPWIVFVLHPHLMQQVIRRAAGRLTHILPKVPQQTDIMVVGDGWPIAVPGNDAAIGIGLNIVVDNMTKIDGKVSAVLGGHVNTVTQ
jgi:hypothetical protein